MTKKTEIRELIEGLEIIEKYESNPEIGVDAYCLYVGNYNPEKMSAEDILRMSENNWFDKGSSWTRFIS